METTDNNATRYSLKIARDKKLGDKRELLIWYNEISKHL
jgi:hypothetical protein